MPNLFPKIVARRCDPKDASACCPGRRDAVRSGRMYWNLELGGWVDKTLPLRSQKDWETIKRAGVDTRDVPYLLDLCPHCSCELPLLFQKKRHTDCEDRE